MLAFISAPLTPFPRALIPRGRAARPPGLEAGVAPCFLFLRAQKYWRKNQQSKVVTRAARPPGLEAGVTAGPFYSPKETKAEARPALVQAGTLASTLLCWFLRQYFCGEEGGVSLVFLFLFCACGEAEESHRGQGAQGDVAASSPLATNVSKCWAHFCISRALWSRQGIGCADTR